LNQRVYTVYRPADLDAVGFALPIFSWLGGGCTAIITSGNEEVFTTLAAAGYLVVAYGSPDPAHFADPEGGSDEQRAAIDWALAQDRDVQSPLFRRLDQTRVAVGGMSCGALESIGTASSDRRVDSVFAVSGGDTDAVQRVTAPIAMVAGGPADIEAAGTTATYEKAISPAFLANHLFADHFAMTPLAPPISDDLTALTTNWLELTFFDDDTAREFILGTPCGICGPTWRAQSKNWERVD
jgi:hypothetical protein